MGVRQIAAILLIVVGLISLLLGGISWTRRETVLDIGPIEATTQSDRLPVTPVSGDCSSLVASPCCS